MDQLVLLKMDNKNIVTVVECNCQEFNKKYYEKNIDKLEGYLLVRTSRRTLIIYDKVGENVPLQIAEINLDIGEQMTDFKAFRVKNSTFVTLVMSDGWVCTSKFVPYLNANKYVLNEEVVHLPGLRLNLTKGEKLISCAISDDSSMVIVSSLYECEDAPRLFRLFVFEICQNTGMLSFLFEIDMSNEQFSTYPNSFFQCMFVFSTPNKLIKNMVGFPHAGGSDRVDMVLDLKRKHLEVIGLI